MRSFPVSTLAFILFLSLSTGGCSAKSPAPADAESATPKAMHLTFSDTFQNGLDRKVWTPALAHPGESNPAGELQHYVPDEVAPIDGGGLRLGSHRRDFAGKAITAGAINSSDGFMQTYGHFEMKAREPVGSGIWTTFWLLPNDNSWPPEIDIAEYFGSHSTDMHVAVLERPQGRQPMTFDAFAPIGGDPGAAYHIYALDWRPDSLEWLIDGKVVHRETEHVPHVPMYIVANLAYGGRWAGPIGPQTALPGAFDIAYIKAYQFDDLTQPEAKPFLLFGKAQLDNRAPKPGENVKLRGQITVGDVPVKGLKVIVALTDFTGASVPDMKTISFSRAEAGKSLPFTADLHVPANAMPGVYNITLKAFIDAPVSDTIHATPQTKLYRGVADQLVVGTPY